MLGKKSIIVTIILISIFVINAFPQEITTSDPFSGVWFVQIEGEKYVFIFTDGILIIISNEWEIEEMGQYIISGNLIIFGESSADSTVWQFFTIGDNKIVMQRQDGSDVYLLEKQKGNDILEKMRNYLSE